MTNLEKYLDEIIRDTENNKPCRLHNTSRTTTHCRGNECKKCKQKLIEWLLEEHKEPIKLTKAEKVILENIDNKFKYIARDLDNLLFIYNKKPKKGSIQWVGYNGSHDFCVFKHLFNFVKWKDEEPYLIEDILKNCEVI